MPSHCEQLRKDYDELKNLAEKFFSECEALNKARNPQEFETAFQKAKELKAEIELKKKP